MSKVAVIAGSSGMVGLALLHQVCASDQYSAVTLLVRRPTGFRHPKVREVIVDFDRLEEHATAIAGDVFFSCLGTTRLKTPDKRTYYQIDHDYPLQLARLASAGSMKQFHYISSVGASTGAKAFYMRMKGETERDIAAVPLETVHIYRPSFLDGYREERRWLERVSLLLMRMVNPLLAGRWRKFRSITAATVAKAMLHQSLQYQPGVHYYESDEIQRLAGT